MRLFFQLLLAESKFQYWEKVKYPIKSIIQFAFLAFIIVGFYWGVEKVSDISLNEINSSLVIGYVLFTSAFTVPILFPAFISAGVENGTLEQHCLSPVKIEYLLLSKVVFEIVRKLLFATILIYFIMFFSQNLLSINLIMFYSLLSISLISLFGVGLALAGLELRFRKFSVISIFFSLGMGVLLTLPAYPLNFLSFFPFLPGAYTINKVIVENSSFPIIWYVFIIINSVFYFLIGLKIFTIFERKARKLNKLGQY